MIVLFKLLTAPVLIAFLTLPSRRFEPTVGILMRDVPLVTGPTPVFTTVENGTAFAQRAAVANLVGQVSTCLFRLCYTVAARRLDCWRSAALSFATFLGATLAWSLFDWSIPAALGLLLIAIVLMLAVMRPLDLDAIARVTPRFDLPARTSGLTDRRHPFSRAEGEAASAA